MQIVQVDTMDMLSLSILVLFLGMFLNRKIKVLGDNYIPPAVTGGLVFASCVFFIYSFGDVQLEFDMEVRNLLLLVFFSTVGLSARFKTLAAGGKALVALVGVAGVFLFLQNAVGQSMLVNCEYSCNWRFRVQGSGFRVQGSRVFSSFFCIFGHL